MSRRSTQKVLYNESKVDYLGMMSILMQLRKVCDHPDLFEERRPKYPYCQTDQIRLDIPSVILLDDVSFSLGAGEYSVSNFCGGRSWGSYGIGTWGWGLEDVEEGGLMGELEGDEDSAGFLGMDMMDGYGMSFDMEAGNAMEVEGSHNAGNFEDMIFAEGSHGAAQTGNKGAKAAAKPKAKANAKATARKSNTGKANPRKSTTNTAAKRTYKRKSTDTHANAIGQPTLRNAAGSASPVKDMPGLGAGFQKSPPADSENRTGGQASRNNFSAVSPNPRGPGNSTRNARFPKTTGQPSRLQKQNSQSIKKPRSLGLKSSLQAITGLMIYPHSYIDRKGRFLQRYLGGGRLYSGFSTSNVVNFCPGHFGAGDAAGDCSEKRKVPASIRTLLKVFGGGVGGGSSNGSVGGSVNRRSRFAALVSSKYSSDIYLTSSRNKNQKNRPRANSRRGHNVIEHPLPVESWCSSRVLAPLTNIVACMASNLYHGSQITGDSNRPNIRANQEFYDRNLCSANDGDENNDAHINGDGAEGRNKGKSMTEGKHQQEPNDASNGVNPDGEIDFLLDALGPHSPESDVDEEEPNNNHNRIVQRNVNEGSHQNAIPQSSHHQNHNAEGSSGASFLSALRAIEMSAIEKAIEKEEAHERNFSAGLDCEWLALGQMSMGQNSILACLRGPRTCVMDVDFKTQLRRQLGMTFGGVKPARKNSELSTSKASSKESSKESSKASSKVKEEVKEQEKAKGKKSSAKKSAAAKSSTSTKAAQKDNQPPPHPAQPRYESKPNQSRYCKCAGNWEIEERLGIEEYTDDENDAASPIPGARAGLSQQASPSNFAQGEDRESELPSGFGGGGGASAFGGAFGGGRFGGAFGGARSTAVSAFGGFGRGAASAGAAGFGGFGGGAVKGPTTQPVQRRRNLKTRQVLQKVLRKSNFPKTLSRFGISSERAEKQRLAFCDREALVKKGVRIEDIDEDPRRDFDLASSQGEGVFDEEEEEEGKVKSEGKPKSQGKTAKTKSEPKTKSENSKDVLASKQNSDSAKAKQPPIIEYDPRYSFHGMTNAYFQLTNCVFLPTEVTIYNTSASDKKTNADQQNGNLDDSNPTTPLDASFHDNSKPPEVKVVRKSKNEDWYYNAIHGRNSRSSFNACSEFDSMWTNRPRLGNSLHSPADKYWTMREFLSTVHCVIPNVLVAARHTDNDAYPGYYYDNGDDIRRAMTARPGGGNPQGTGNPDNAGPNTGPNTTARHQLKSKINLNDTGSKNAYKGWVALGSGKGLVQDGGMGFWIRFAEENLWAGYVHDKLVCDLLDELRSRRFLTEHQIRKRQLPKSFLGGGLGTLARKANEQFAEFVLEEKLESGGDIVFGGSNVFRGSTVYGGIPGEGPSRVSVGKFYNAGLWGNDGFSGGPLLENAGLSDGNVLFGNRSIIVTEKPYHIDVRFTNGRILKAVNRNTNRTGGFGNGNRLNPTRSAHAAHAIVPVQEKRPMNALRSSASSNPGQFYNGKEYLNHHAPIHSQFLKQPYHNTPILMPNPNFLINDCGKFQVMIDLLKQCQMRKDRCIIFTQFTKMLDILERFVNLQKYNYLRLDGKLKGAERQILVENFNRDTSVFILLASTRAGGIGINLTGKELSKRYIAHRIEDLNFQIAFAPSPLKRSSRYSTG